MIAVNLRADRAPAEDQAQRQVCEFFDLFLPLGFQRGGGDDQHAPRLAEVVQERAGGDRLDGFSKAHLVGEKRPFLERQMQHAFALIREKRAVRDVLRMAAIRDPGLVGAAAEDPVLLPGTGFHPRPNILRNPQEAASAGSKLLHQFFRCQLIKLNAIAIETGAVLGREFCGVALDAQAAGGRVCNHIRARRRDPLCRLEFGPEPARELKQDRLDVLAGAEPVDAEIRAGAGKLARRDIADLGAVGHAARRFDFKIREDRVGGVEVRDPEFFLAGTEPPLGQLVGIGRPPVGVGGQCRPRRAGFSFFTNHGKTQMRREIGRNSRKWESLTAATARRDSAKRPVPSPWRSNPEHRNEPGLFEMVVGRERVANAGFLHERKAHAVGK